MKKIISVFAIVFALTMVMTVSAFAAGQFSVDTTSLPEGIEIDIPDATGDDAEPDTMYVTVNGTTEGEEYVILLVQGKDAYPTAYTTDDGVTMNAGETIAYIDQQTAEDEYVEFAVLPGPTRFKKTTIAKDPVTGKAVKELVTDYTLYVTTSAGVEKVLATYVEIPEEEPTTYMVGDVDGDTSITIGDVTTLIDKVLERIEYFTDSAQNVLPFHVGDVDNDESVTIGDVTTVIDRVLERITSFPRTSCELPAGTTAESTYPVE